MEFTRTIFASLQYFSRIIAVGYGITALHSALAFILKSPALIRFVEDGQHFETLYPFTARRFLRGENTTTQMAEMLVVFVLYSVFFWLLGGIFETIRQKQTNTPEGIAVRKRFALANIVIPALALLMLSLFTSVAKEGTALVAFHLMLGVFTFFTTITLKRTKLFTGLRYLSQIIGIGYGLTALYSALAFILNTPTMIRPVQDDTTRFAILYPFTETPFLLGKNTSVFIAEMLLLLVLYSIFFWLLANVFDTFSKEKLFTEQGITNLTSFYVANLTVPIVVLILLSSVSSIGTGLGVIVVLHAILGIFAFLITAIFKQGVSLQTEQDLFV